MVMTSLLLTVALFAPADERLDQASEFLSKGWYGDAIDLLETMRDEGAGDQTAVAKTLAEAYLGDGDVAGALELLDALEPDYDVALLKGDAYDLWAEQLAWDGASADDVRVMRMDAANSYRKAVELAPPGDSTASIRLGYVHLYGLGDYETALEIAENGLARRPGEGEMLLLRGCALVYDFWAKQQSDPPDGADDAWDQAVDDLIRADEALGGERTEPQAQLKWLYQTRGRGVDAVNAATKVTERQDDPDLTPLYEMAKQYAYARDWPPAARALEVIVSTDAGFLRKSIRREGDNADAVARELHWAFNVFGNRNDDATARAILEAITSADPKEPVIWANYAVACESTRRFEDALTAYDKKIALAPDDPRTYNDKATLLHTQLNRSKDEAIPLYEKSIAMCKEQLAADDIADADRRHLEETLRVAQGNLDGLKPAPSLLDSVLDRLKAVDNKDDGEGESDEGGETTGG